MKWPGRPAVSLMINLVLCSLIKATAHCPPKCECKWKGGKESVVCTNASLQHIPAGLDPTTQVLDLSANPLKQLPAGAFRQMGLYNVQRAILQRCGLKEIDGGAWQGLTNLVEIDLSHNLLTQVPSQALESVPQLRELRLNNNPLEKLENHVFAAASQLVRLELSACQISVIQPRAFHGLELLEWLRLDGNLIEILPPASLLSLRSIRGLDLHNNPWLCSCALRPVRSWLDARNMPFSVPPLCYTPPRLRGQSWNRVEPDELACRPAVEVQENPVQAVTNQKAKLTCLLKGFPEASVDWFLNKKRLANVTSVGGRQILISQRNKTFSELLFTSVREQDSGIYSCSASNKAGSDVVNVTLIVTPSERDESAHWSRTLTAGLLLGSFVLLMLGLIFCCVFSLRRVRSPKIIRTANEASSPPEKVELLERCQLSSSNNKIVAEQQQHQQQTKGIAGIKYMELAQHEEPTVQDPLVLQSAAAAAAEEKSLLTDDEHRPLALHCSKKVSLVDAESITASLTTPTFKNAAVSPISEFYPDPILSPHFPDLVEQTTSYPVAQYPLARHRRPLSEWDMASDISWIEMEPRRSMTPLEEPYEYDWYSRRDSNGDFQRRYAYHTQQLDRFLAEYRTLQQRLANLHGVCARWSIPAAENRPPLRPILKYPSVNRFGSLERHGTLQRRYTYYEDDQFS